MQHFVNKIASSLHKWARCEWSITQSVFSMILFFCNWINYYLLIIFVIFKKPKKKQQQHIYTIRQTFKSSGYKFENEKQRGVKRNPVCKTPAEVAVSELAGCQFIEAERVTALWQLFVSGKFAANCGKRHSQGPLHESTRRHGLHGLPPPPTLCSPRSSLFLVGTATSPIMLKPGSGCVALNTVSCSRKMFCRVGSLWNKLLCNKSRHCDEFRVYF